MPRMRPSTPLLPLLLTLAAAHPPVDVPVNDTDVLAAAAVAVDAMLAGDTTARVAEYHVLSARRQLVSGFNYFLVLAMAADRNEPYAAWTLCSATVYTDFAGTVQDCATTHATPRASAPRELARSGFAAPDGCGGELSAPAPLESSATVEVAEMVEAGVVTHDERVELRECWHRCGADGALVQHVWATLRTNETVRLAAATAARAPSAAPAPAPTESTPRCAEQCAEASGVSALLLVEFGGVSTLLALVTGIVTYTVAVRSRDRRWLRCTSTADGEMDDAIGPCDTEMVVAGPNDEPRPQYV